MAAVLLLSNGHGEDLSGALIGSALMARGVSVEALPLVGHGKAYRQRGIAVVAPTRECRTGGLGFTSFQGQLSELLDGQVAHVLANLGRLLRHRGRHQLVVAVGDLVAVLGAWLGGQRAAVYLVAYSSHYEGRLRLPWPCGWLLRRPAVRAIWSRDALTARDLSQQLGRAVTFRGNPFLDAALAPFQIAAEAADGPARATAAHHTPPPQRLALLPGSRLPEARDNLALMLQMLELLPAALHQRRLLAQAALVPALDRQRIGELAAARGWRWVGADRLRRNGLELVLSWSGFGATLQAADLVLAMAGTATEQAVGLAKPVVQLVGEGPQFTAGFAEAQRRLLGSGVYCAPWGGDREAMLRRSAQLTSSLLEELAQPGQGNRLRRDLARNAAVRIGPPGGTERLAAAIMDLLPSCHG
ncbi:lipid-A-disaccharide synthase-related protein [Cyanobium sp. NIES-981]|uniref:lipid-A-disaccharide synthase-related protein n=1 Tax=Cyanobium sp. NIES-981 TaxID=1851505 RepID=UPI0007DDFFDF|nr:lipid-A-disaccharide synthase-related protein [Cyanobium sp. NIES-981]SBO44812.1 conserved protein of unknown function [Cyanobium sp. NIES-981]